MTHRNMFSTWVVIARFVNVMFMLSRGRSGLAILSAFPKFNREHHRWPGHEWPRLTEWVGAGEFVPDVYATGRGQGGRREDQHPDASVASI